MRFIIFMLLSSCLYTTGAPAGNVGVIYDCEYHRNNKPRAVAACADAIDASELYNFVADNISLPMYEFVLCTPRIQPCLIPESYDYLIQEEEQEGDITE